MKILKLVENYTSLYILILLNYGLHLVTAELVDANSLENNQSHVQNRRRAPESPTNRSHHSLKRNRTQRMEEVSQMFGKHDNYPAINKNYVRSNFSDGFISSSSRESRNNPRAYSDSNEELNVIDTGASLINPKKFAKQSYNRSPTYDIILSDDKSTKSQSAQVQNRQKGTTKSISERSQSSSEGRDLDPTKKNKIEDLLLDAKETKIQTRNDSQIQLIDAMIDILAQSIERRRTKNELNNGNGRRAEDASLKLEGKRVISELGSAEPWKNNNLMRETSVSRISREDNGSVQEIDYAQDADFDLETTRVGRIIPNQTTRSSRVREKSPSKIQPGRSGPKHDAYTEADFNLSTSNTDLVLVKAGKSADQVQRARSDSREVERKRESAKKSSPKLNVRSINSFSSSEHPLSEDKMLARSQNLKLQRVMYTQPVHDTAAEPVTDNEDQMSLLRSHRPLVAHDLLNVRRQQHNPYLHQSVPVGDEENQRPENMFASAHPYFRPPLGSNDGSSERMRLNPNSIDELGMSRLDPSLSGGNDLTKLNYDAERNQAPGELRGLPPSPMLRPGYKHGPPVPPYNGQQLDWSGAPEHRIGSAVDYPNLRTIPQAAPFVNPLHQLLMAAKNQQSAALAYEKRRLDHEARWRDEALRRQHDANIDRQRLEAARQQQEQQQEEQKHQQPQATPERSANAANENDSNNQAPNEQTNGAMSDQNEPETNRLDKQEEPQQHSNAQNNETGPASQQENSGEGANGNDSELKNFQNFAGADTDFTDLFPPGILTKAEIEEMRKQQQDQQRREQDEDEQRRIENSGGEQENNGSNEEQEGDGGEQNGRTSGENRTEREQSQEQADGGTEELKAQMNATTAVDEQKPQQQAVVPQPVALVQMQANGSINSAPAPQTLSPTGGRPPSFLFNNATKSAIGRLEVSANDTSPQMEQTGNKTRRNIVAKGQQQAQLFERDFVQLRPNSGATTSYQTQAITPTEFDDVADKIVLQTSDTPVNSKPQLWAQTSLVSMRAKQPLRTKTRRRSRNDNVVDNDNNNNSNSMRNNIFDATYANGFSDFRQMLESSAVVVDGDSDIEDNVFTLNRT